MTAENIITGRVYVLDDNIDTDQIIPAEYLNLVPTIPEEYRELGSHAMAGLPASYAPFVERGSEKSEYTIIIGGRNFGCGSSREHAPVCLGAAGLIAVVAESYARIFFRNAIATGEVYPLEAEARLCDVFQTGDEAEINLADNSITRVISRETYLLKPLGEIAPVIAAGGIFGYGREAGLIPEKPEDSVEHIEDHTVIEDEEAEERETPVASVTAEDLAKLKSKIVAVANQKGGVGKTTTVINLSAYLASLDQKVLVVDLDPQANATSGLGLPKQSGTSLYGPLLGEGDAASLIQPTVVDGVDILPSELDLAGSEVDVARTDGYLHCFSTVLVPLLQVCQYDYVIVDCPPSLGILTMNALTAAHSLIVPMQCEYYALEGLSVFHHLIEQLRDSGANPNLELEGIIMTMFDRRTRLGTQVVKEVRKHFGSKVYRTIIPRNVRLSEAPSYGQPIMIYDRHSTGARAYRNFAKEFLKWNTESDSRQQKKTKRKPTKSRSVKKKTPAKKPRRSKLIRTKKKQKKRR